MNFSTHALRLTKSNQFFSIPAVLYTDSTMDRCS
jgi:hypothetical protein